jgi:hypothetical protein
VIRVRDIIEASAATARLQPRDLLDRANYRHIARPRARAMYLARTLRPDLSYPAIARAFDGRNHTTVLHHERGVAARLAEGDEQERAAIRATLKALGLPEDLDLAALTLKRQRDGVERRRSLEARRNILARQLAAVEQQLAALDEADPS